MRLDQLQAEAIEALSQAGIENARQEARWLVSAASDVSVGQLFTSGSRQLTADQIERVREMLGRRVGHEPLQYILGTADFRGFELAVGPGVLVPRPETELLVELACEKYSGQGAVCDLCTGSGAVALALAEAFPSGTSIVGVDCSAAALAYALQNRATLGLSQVEFVQGDLFNAVSLSAVFSLVTANPPYVAPDEYVELPCDVRDFEPREALVAEDNGLALLRRIACETKKHLIPDGWLLCEIGCAQGPDVMTMFEAESYVDVRIVQDHSDLDRVVLARGPNSMEN